ncbi:unnamed protein product [Urochloa decumbens]|uniref:Uncharacterized protein n=1 Tax=Urochloa decumbens TaxID=240449 RepID=A0ABC8VEE8_9POAL
MAVRSGAAANFLTLLCFWLVVLTAIGGIAVARADSSYCESPNPPRRPPADFQEGTCPPPQR